MDGDNLKDKYLDAEEKDVLDELEDSFNDGDIEVVSDEEPLIDELDRNEKDLLFGNNDDYFDGAVDFIDDLYEEVYESHVGLIEDDCQEFVYDDSEVKTVIDKVRKENPNSEYTLVTITKTDEKVVSEDIEALNEDTGHKSKYVMNVTVPEGIGKTYTFSNNIDPEEVAKEINNTPGFYRNLLEDDFGNKSIIFNGYFK